MNDLPIPLYVTATDLVKGKLKIFADSTKIVDAILASSSIPGVISPYEINEKLYSDGGILNHFPTDILQGRCEYIIGVYVSTVQKITAKDLRSIKAVTTRAFELLVANSNLQKFNNCDWLIEPDELSSFNTFETNKAKMDQIFEIGYQAAKKSFESLAG